MELTYEQKQEKLNEIKNELFDIFPTAKEITVKLKGDNIEVTQKEDFK